MRGLWTQASRPRLRNSHCFSSTDSLTSALVRKTTTRPPRRRPGFGDAFTVLLTPVLAAALFVDTSWKSKQRKDWDERLAALDNEIDSLKERERQLRSSLQLRNVGSGLSQQRRYYATAVQAQVQDDEVPGDIEMPIWSADPGQEDNVIEDERIPIRQVVSAREFSAEQLSNFKRYHRLNAITLALRMLLHLRVGPNHFYSIFPSDDPMDSATSETSEDVGLPSDTNRLAEMLALTRKQMRSLGNLEDLFYVAPRIQAQAARGGLQQAIKELTAEFDAGRISLAGLIDGYGKAVLQTDEVPSVSVYVMLIRSLSKVGSHSLAYHAVAALKRSTLPLSDPAIFYMLLQIGRACDSRSLNHMLHFIAKADNPLNVIHKWEKARVNGLDLPVPTTLNPRLLMVLVYASLRCEQPTRAEAWLTLLREADYGSMWKDDLFRSFLAYYSQHGNWEEGKKWVQRSVKHALTIANQSIDRLARVIYRMLDLCVRCRKLAEYTTILDAAVDSGIGPPLVDKTQNDRRTFHPRTRSILLEWESLPLPDNVEEFAVQEKARSFQLACRSLMEELSGRPQKAPSSRDNVDSELVLMAPTAQRPNLRYTVRRPTSGSPAATDGDHSSVELDKLQSRFTQQEAIISQLKTKLDLAELRQRSYQEEQAQRAQRWIKSTSALAEELRDSKERYEKLQKLNELYEQERANMRAEMSTLKAVAEQLVLQGQKQNIEVPAVERTEAQLPEIVTKEEGSTLPEQKHAPIKGENSPSETRAPTRLIGMPDDRRNRSKIGPIPTTPREIRIRTYSMRFDKDIRPRTFKRVQVKTQPAPDSASVP
ncbi:uncharacterized protein A1O5_11559 [Cladophialophora psammophila CBS 110553]|uniref:Uncharacterized protein n=1 Tax=Cladophialophora psammophila CBS 110553 TaxID=1182543 RepID=W9WEU4_9EURO|nr:uncharacterized protein A1O5_11559 [Cladophialophora psammophila CBS 110553]EXJ63510.1 hypothetical protein A1O5_11559 [Cladophialophora psammophila CBS 110553]